LLGLINTVLDIAKIESGQFTLNMTEYAIESVVETLRAATESLAQNKKLTRTTSVDKSLPVGLGDEQRLTQVLLNLVSARWEIGSRIDWQVGRSNVREQPMRRSAGRRGESRAAAMSQPRERTAARTIVSNTGFTSVGELLDDAQDVSCGGLAAQCHLGLVGEAGVLDGYDGLVGKSLEQIDLSIGERANLRASDGNHADGLSCADQWDGQYGAVANASGEVPAFGVIPPSACMSAT